MSYWRALPIRYQPATGFIGTEHFCHTARSGGVNAPGAVAVVVRANRPPVALADSFSVAKNSPVVGLLVLANDRDPDVVDTPKDAILVTALGAPNHGGTVAIASNKARVLYQPAPGFTGTETFRYTISDDSRATATALVTVTVH